MIQIPAMLILLPGAPVATILGTNKFASCAGTTIAVPRYARHVAIDCSTIYRLRSRRFAFSFLGSRTVTLLNTGIHASNCSHPARPGRDLRLLLQRPRLIHQPRHAPKRRNVLGVLIGAGIGFSTTASSYPAPAAFIFLFVGIFGSIFCRRRPPQSDQLGHEHRLGHLLRLSGNIIYQYACRGVCNVLGARSDPACHCERNRFVRIFFLVIVCALIAKLAQSIIARSVP